MDILLVLIIITVIAVLGVLFAGLFAMGRKGEGSAKRSNMLMRARVILQFVAIGLILLYAILKMAG